MRAAALRRPRSTTLAVLALWALFYASFTLVRPALLDDADSVHAEAAREMLLRHDWVTLYANGIRYLEKAPLLYWTMAASMRGAQAMGARRPEALAVAARVPLALTVLALAFLVETLARRVFRNTRAGLYAALIAMSCPGIFLFTRITLPDAMVCLWLTGAMLCFGEIESGAALPPARTGFVDEAWDWSAEEEDPRWLCYGFAAFCALGVLTKGMIGVVFPLAIVAVYLLLTRGVRGAFVRVYELHPWSSALVFLAIAAPWHVLAALANPAQGSPGQVLFGLHATPHWVVPLPTQGNVHGWAWFYFINEQVLRYVNARVPRDYNTVPLWLFWLLCLVWMMPWSAFMFKALGPVAQFMRSVVSDVRTRNRSRLQERLRYLRWHRLSRAFTLLAVWAAVPLVFFSFSTRQEYYVLPSLPALAVLIAGWLGLDGRVEWPPHTPATRAMRRANLRATAVLAALGGVFALAAMTLLLRGRRPPAGADLASLLAQNPGDYAMSMGHFLDLNAQALALFRVPLALAAASLLLGPLVSYWLRRRARPHQATLALATGGFGFLLAVHLALVTFAPVLSSAQLAQAMRPLVKPEDLIVIHQEYEYGSTLGFYLERPEYFRGGAAPVVLNPLHILTEPSYDGKQNYGRSANLWYGSFFPDAPKIFETAASLEAKWHGAQRIWVWQDLGNQPAPLPATLTPVYVIARSGGKEIVSNQPDETAGTRPTLGAHPEPASAPEAGFLPAPTASVARDRHHRQGRARARRRHRRSRRAHGR